jgi:putative CRISPR-associated protein (TIGR02619 family)
MSEPWFVFSPCGTSLLTNSADSNERKLVNRFANYKMHAGIPADEANLLNALIERVREAMVTADDRYAATMSAELNAITKLYQGKPGNQQHFHQLLCTDTWLGEATAGMVADWLRKQGYTVDVKRQPDLQTADLQAFQLALSDLVRWCHETLPGYRQKPYRIIFNLTGGFKSVQGFLQTMAMFYADETIYVFETGRALLRIPRVPISMNAEDTVRNHLNIFRRLASGLEIADTPVIPETLLMQLDNKVTLSPWGDLVWEQTKDRIYAEQLYSPPSAKLRFGEKFQDTILNLPPERLVQVNKRIDQLARYLETNGQYNPHSLDFKKLRGHVALLSTHEMDAWSDQDAKRLFGHYEEEMFVLDRLAAALH